MAQEFKEFIARGEVIMLAVGFIMGVAFSALVTSVVEDIVMPVIAIPFGEPDFSTSPSRSTGRSSSTGRS